jgi:hypothetical protein
MSETGIMFSNDVPSHVMLAQVAFSNNNYSGGIQFFYFSGNDRQRYGTRSREHFSVD